MKQQLHVLKTNPEIFELVKNGTKTFEYRKNDRDFKLGDLIILSKWEHNGFSEKLPFSLKITYILYGGQFGIPKEYCIFSWCNHGCI